MQKTNKIKYIVFEGIVGTGKTTQIKKILEWLNKEYPKVDVITTREPGGSEIADNIRKAVQGTEYKEEMDPICEAYLYASSRAQTLRTIVKPAIDKNILVLSDRSFFTSTAFQGGGRELGIEKILKINKEAVEDTVPDLVIYMDIDPKISLKRTSDHKGDKFEKLDISFFKKVQKGYEDIQSHKEYFGKWINIDATGTVDEVFEKIIDILKQELKL